MLMQLSPNVQHIAHQMHTRFWWEIKKWLSFWNCHQQHRNLFRREKTIMCVNSCNQGHLFQRLQGVRWAAFLIQVEVSAPNKQTMYSVIISFHYALTFHTQLVANAIFPSTYNSTNNCTEPSWQLHWHVCQITVSLLLSQVLLLLIDVEWTKFIESLSFTFVGGTYPVDVIMWNISLAWYH